MTGILKRVADLVVVMLCVATMVFVLLRAIPGDPVLVMGGLDNIDATAVQRARVEMGLDRSLPEQFLLWLAGAVRGDLGASLRSGSRVSELIAGALPVTLQLGGLALLIGLAISVPAGIAAARRAGTARDAGITAFAIVGISTPPFVIAMALIYIFAVVLGVLPTSGFVPFAEDPVANLRHMILPAVTLGLVAAGVLVRMMRRCVLDELGEDYVRLARSKGISETRVTYRHAARNAMIPFVTIVGVEAGILLSGAVITETLFAVPGLGRLMIDNINQRDYPVVQGAVLVTAIIYVAINSGVDALYAILDPRIGARVRSREG